MRIIIANSFQIWLSLLYFLTNGLMTAVCAQAEWSSYTNNRKGLRVSGNRRFDQRSTYFLQIPYRYSVPLLVVFGGAHWLLSQAVFLKDEVWKSTDADTITYTTIGFTPLGIFIILGLLALLFVFILVQGLSWTTMDMPMLRSCSAVIAAACQPLGDNASDEVQLKKLQWGVMCEPLESNVGETGHCAFSAGYVDLPVEGRTYAG